MAQRWLAVLVCAALFVCIWIATIWNNFAFRNGLIADDYLLPVAVMALLIVVLGINPLLKLFAPRLSFSRRGLVVLCGVFFMAALPPSAGILRQLAFPLGEAVHRANTQQTIAEAYEALSPPSALYPDTLEYNADIPVVEPFIDELDPGESVPWHGWLAPIVSWSGLVIPWFVMMLALSVIMARYWQNEERVALPLLTIFRSLTDVPEDRTHKIPPIFKSRSFWIGCLAVFVLHSLVQGQRYYPGSVPCVPLRWNLALYFKEPPWNYLGWWMKHGQLYFSFLAVAFFLPNRTSFSIWFFQVILAFYVMIGRAYFAPYQGYGVTDMRTGSIIMFSLVVTWLARRHLGYVARSMFVRVRSPRDRAYRIAGWVFVVGCAGMFAWFIWVRVPVVYTVLFVVTAVMVTLTLMRVVAETGLPLFFFGTETFTSLLRLIPLGLRSLPGMYFGGLLASFLGSGQRVCVGAVATQALALDRDSDVPRHVRLGGLFLVVLVVSLICAWLLILYMSYHYSETPGGNPIAWWGRQQFRHGENLLLSTIQGGSPAELVRHVPYMFSGSMLVILLYNLCQMFPAWPLHPIGLLGAGTWCVAQIWPNIFLGWLIRNLLVKLGGTHVYIAARPLFIGMLMGELFALAAWSSVAGVLALNDMDYYPVNILPF